MNKEEEIKEIYEDVSLGLKSANKMYLYFKEKSSDISREDIENFLSKRVENQLNKVVKNDNFYSKIISKGIGENVQIDTMDLNAYKRQNKNYRYVLVCIDVYSRKVFLKALENKSASEVVKAMVGIKKEFEKNGTPIKSIITDLGLEYNNKYFNRLFSDLNEKGKIFRKNDETFNSALAIVDRVMRTILSYFKKLFILNGNFVWINDLYNIDKNYNETFHSSIKEKPNNVFYKKLKTEINYDGPIEKLEIGQLVRIKNVFKKNIFSKNHSSIWSEETYKITDYTGIGYLIDNGRRKYFRHELLPIDENTLKNKDKTVEKVKDNQKKITEFFKSNKIDNKVNRAMNKLK